MTVAIVNYPRLRCDTQPRITIGAVYELEYAAALNSDLSAREI